MKRLIIIAILWIACGLGAAGMLVAGGASEREYAGKPPRSHAEIRDCRMAIGLTVFLAPAMFPIALFSSGFGYDGWTLSCGKIEQ